MVPIPNLINVEILADMVHSLRVQVHTPWRDEGVGCQMGLRERPRDDQELLQDL